MRSRYPTNPQALVAARVRELVDKFEYPDEIGGGAPAVGEGGGGAPTIVIAASDATDISKSKADFIATGVNDEAVFDAALDLLALTGGRLLLSEGEFGFGNATLFTPNRPITIQGMGESTLIRSSGTGTVIEFVGDGSGIRDLVFVGTAVFAPARFIRFDESGWVENVFFSAGAKAIELQGEGYIIRSCSSDGVPIFVDGSPFGSDVLIEGNGYFDTGPIGRIILGANANNWTIANNVLAGGIEDSGSATRQVIITGNIWEFILYTAAGHAIIDLGGGDADRLIVSDNIVLDGDSNTFLRLRSSISQAEIKGNITVSNIDDGIVSNGLAQASIIAGNSITCGGIGISITGTWEDGMIEGNHISAGEHGISLGGMLRGHIHGNTIFRPGVSADNTFDGIILSGANSDETFIHGNRINLFSFGNAARYGINISEAQCTCNIVVGNDLGPVANYGTDALNNAGADTRLFWPNDATYGDNFIGCFGS